MQFGDARRAPPTSGGGAADREQPPTSSAVERQGRTSAPIGGRGYAQLGVCALERQYWNWRAPRPALFYDGGKQ